MFEFLIHTSTKLDFDKMIKGMEVGLKCMMSLFVDPYQKYKLVPKNSQRILENKLTNETFAGKCVDGGLWERVQSAADLSREVSIRVGPGKRGHRS